MSNALKDYNKNITDVGTKITKETGEFLDFDLDPHMKNTFAIIIKQQNVANNTVGSATYAMPNYLKKLSLAVTLRTLLTLPNIISIQTGAVDEIYRFGKAGDIDSLFSRKSLLKTMPILHMQDLGNDFKYDEKNLDIDSNELSLNLSDTLSRGIIKEMGQSAKTKLSLNEITTNAIIAGVTSVNDGIKNKIGKSGTFVILPLPIAKILKDEIVPDHSFDVPQTDIRRIGLLRNKWIFYINNYPGIDIVIGYQGIHPLDSGYVYHLKAMFHSHKKELGKLIVAQNSNLYVADGNFYGKLSLNAEAILDSIKGL
jgi:hypothetical protein